MITAKSIRGVGIVCLFFVCIACFTIVSAGGSLVTADDKDRIMVITPDFQLLPLSAFSREEGQQIYDWDYSGHLMELIPRPGGYQVTLRYENGTMERRFFTEFSNGKSFPPIPPGCHEWDYTLSDAEVRKALQFSGQKMTFGEFLEKVAPQELNIMDDTIREMAFSSPFAPWPTPEEADLYLQKERLWTMGLSECISSPDQSYPTSTQDVTPTIEYPVIVIPSSSGEAMFTPEMQQHLAGLGLATDPKVANLSISRVTREGTDTVKIEGNTPEGSWKSWTFKQDESGLWYDTNTRLVMNADMRFILVAMNVIPKESPTYSAPASFIATDGYPAAGISITIVPARDQFIPPGPRDTSTTLSEFPASMQNKPEYYQYPASLSQSPAPPTSPLPAYLTTGPTDIPSTALLIRSPSYPLVNAVPGPVTASGPDTGYLFSS
jgi:hypothetical protein